MITSTIQSSQPFYPSSDGEPVAETYTHLYALLTTLEVLRQYLKQRQATVLANQFLYYAQGFPKLRVAPDVMVIFDVTPGGRDNYKVWEERQVPKVIFEMTSKKTQEQDTNFKKTLYEQLEVQEYWLFDPKGEWIKEQLRGYRLQKGSYELITDSRSEPLQLRLAVEGEVIGFYRNSGEKLLIPEELAAALRGEVEARQQAESRAAQAQEQMQQAEERAQQAEEQAQQMESLLARYRERFGELPQ